MLQFVSSVSGDLLVRNVLFLVNYCTTITLETGVFTKIQSNNATSFLAGSSSTTTLQDLLKSL